MLFVGRQVKSKGLLFLIRAFIRLHQQVLLIALDTLPGKDGSVDRSHVLAVARSIGVDPVVTREPERRYAHQPGLSRLRTKEILKKTS